MCRNYILVITILLGGAWATSTELTTDMCSYFKDCTCFSHNEYEVQCPLSNVGIVMQFTPDEKIQIDCYFEDKYGLNNLPNVQINVSEFTVRFCQLPFLRFEHIVHKFNITNLKHLKIEECKLGNNSLSKIGGRFFEGIVSLETLTINAVTQFFAEDVFVNFPNLEQLYMEKNKLTKIGYVFENITRLKVLHLSRNLLKTLPAGIFKKLTDLRELHLWQNQLANISQDYFVGLKNLKSLELSVNSIEYVDENAFSELRELVNISLRANKLGNISYNIFKNNYKLENIRIDTNPNVTITDYVFANLVNLKTIAMYQCDLLAIPEHTFENCTNLIILDLKNNRLKQLPKNLFTTLRRLQILNLSNNKLSSLPRQIFLSLENLQDLNLEGNQLTSLNRGTFQGLGKLKYLVLKHNKITYIDSGAFLFLKKLQKLDLSHNELTDNYKYALSTLEKIERIFINHNNISNFPEEILMSAVKLKVLDLSHNYLNYLLVTSLVKVSNSDVNVNLTHNSISSVNFFNANYVAEANKQTDAYHNSNYTNTQVNLSQNPLSCNCSNFELIQYLNGNLDPSLKIIAEIQIGDVRCFDPPSFKHIFIKDLRPEQVICEYTKSGCPSECKCYERSYDSAIVVDCSSRNLTYWPQLKFESAKQIEVNMVQNLLESGPPKNYGYEMVKNLFLSHNRLKTFDWCPSYIEILKLDHNNLSSLSSNVLQTISKSEQFSNLTLQSNQWSCSCSAFDLQNFLKMHYNKTQVDRVLCEDNKTRIINKKNLCKSVSIIVAQIAIPILLFFFITACVIAFYFKFKKEIKIWLFSKGWCLWFVTEDELDKDKKYDIFLSFSHKDEDFVAQNLVPSLEKSFKLCIHSRDWIPGELINDQIVDSVYNSRRTVVVLSNNFLESAWGKLEFLMAHKQSIEEGRPRVIVVKLGDLNSDKMNDDFKAYIKTNTYVEWGEPWFWKKLLYALPHSNKNLSKIHSKHANIMLKIDDKFELVSQYILQPDSTPPVISDNSTLLKKHPLNFNISSSINNFHPEVPLMNNK